MTKEQTKLVFMAVYNYIARTYDVCYAWRYRESSGFPELYQALSKTYLFGIEEATFNECVEYALQKFKMEIVKATRIDNKRLAGFANEFLTTIDFDA